MFAAIFSIDPERRELEGPRRFIFDPILPRRAPESVLAGMRGADFSLAFSSLERSGAEGPAIRRMRLRLI